MTGKGGNWSAMIANSSAIHTLNIPKLLASMARNILSGSLMSTIQVQVVVHLENVPPDDCFRHVTHTQS